MKKSAIILMLITVMTKIFGFVREIVLSYYYGASYITDAYLISLTIPVTIFSLIGTSIVTGYIPLYSQIIKEEDKLTADIFTSNLINIIFIICIILAVFVQLFTPQLVKIFAYGFEGEILNLSVEFTRIFIFSIFFYSISFVLSGYLNCNSIFGIPAIASVPLNIVSIISIIISKKYGYVYLSIGMVLAVLSQVLLIMIFVYKKGFRYRFKMDIKDDNIKKIGYLALPVIIGSSVNQLNVLVDRTIASNIAVGGITALNYANRLNLFIQSIFVLSLTTVMYPSISKMVAEKNMDGVRKSVSEVISGINILILPITVGSMLFAYPIVNLLFGHGAFDANAVFLTSQALFYYSIGMIGYALREVLSKVFYSLQDTRTPMINAAMAMVINIILNIILSSYMGLNGLALATSISGVTCTVLLFISLRKKIGSFGIGNITISFIKILCASLVMGVIARLSYSTLNNKIGNSLSLIISIGIGMVAYFIMIYFMKLEDVDTMITALKERVKKARTLS